MWRPTLMRLKESRWALICLVGCAVVAVTFLPQVVFWVERNGNWQGMYALAHTDELVYSAYLNSLMQGKPRRTNPYLPQQESGIQSSFSLQFLPPYAIYAGAYPFSTSAAIAFIFLTPLMAFISSFAVYWLLSEVTHNRKVAAVGVLIVLLCGVIASQNPFAIKDDYPVFAFLRRYVPAVPFPFFFTFCVSAWLSFKRKGMYAHLWALAAALSFVVLVYSYLFLWTAAIAWMFCFTVLWVLLRPNDRAQTLGRAGVICVLMIVALLPYSLMLSERSDQIGLEQSLALTHRPNLFQFTEILGVVLLFVLAYGLKRKGYKWTSPETLFAASCAITPFVVFNQQVLTGRSFQPFHYEQMILNYLLLVGFVVADQLLWQALTKYSLWFTALAITIGVALALKTATVASVPNLAVDQAVPILNKLQSENVRDGQSRSVLFHDPLLALSAPTTASTPILWSQFMSLYGGISTAESTERLFQYFYYLGQNEEGFKKAIKGVLLYRAALFGSRRVYSNITQEFEPVSDEEIRDQVSAYSAYIHGFSSVQACRWPLSHVVVTTGYSFDYSNLDRWYQRDKGETLSGSVVYRVQLMKGLCSRVESY